MRSIGRFTGKHATLAKRCRSYLALAAVTVFVLQSLPPIKISHFHGSQYHSHASGGLPHSHGVLDHHRKAQHAHPRPHGHSHPHPPAHFHEHDHPHEHPHPHGSNHPREHTHTASHAEPQLHQSTDHPVTPIDPAGDPEHDLPGSEYFCPLLAPVVWAIAATLPNPPGVRDQPAVERDSPVSDDLILPYASRAPPALESA